MPLGATEQAPGAIRTAASRDDTPAPLQTPQTGAQRKAGMATTFIQNMREDPEPNALRAVSEELHALALRRAAHHAQQQQDTSTEEQR